MNDLRICLGVPSGEMVHAKFMLAFVSLMMQSQHFNLDYINYRSSRITANRNEIVKFARERNSTHLLFIDSDMVFPPYALQELINHDKDIVCATATKREDGPNDPIGTPMTVEEAVTSKRLIKMQFVGMPFMLIKMSVFDKLPEIPFAEPVMDGKLIPEDEFFCRNVLAAGYDIWCDLGLSMQIGHMGTKEYKISPVAPPKLELVKVA